MASFKGHGGCEPGHSADVGNVAFGVVLGWRCPSAYDLLNGTQSVLVSIGAEQAEGGSDAPFHGGELHKVGVGLLRPLPLPFGGCAADVQRVVVSDSSCHDKSKDWTPSKSPPRGRLITKGRGGFC